MNFFASLLIVKKTIILLYLTHMVDINELKMIATQVRRDIVKMVHKSQSGHPGGSLGCTDFLVALYFHHLKHDPRFNIDGPGEDLFFLSNGHISPVWYSVLARSGYFDVKELGTFRTLNSRLQAIRPRTKNCRAFALLPARWGKACRWLLVPR